MFVLLASTIGGHLAEGKKQSHVKGKGEHFGRKITGGFLTMLLASLFAEVAAEPAALLAVSVAAYAFFNDGLPAITKGFPNTKKQETANEKLERAIREKGGTVFAPLAGSGPQGSPSPVNFGGQLT
jgi:hypothetical protein